MAGWPEAGAYQEAIQNPDTAFEDRDLIKGVAEVEGMGLPRPRSGAFATVFKMQCGGTNWAVRVFTREIIDSQARYEQIDLHLRKNRFPCFMRFEYIPRGIRVEQAWYPILKMQWADGELLKNYIESQLSNPSALDSLANNILELSRRLHSVNIAHGDLQHNNIVVASDGVKLVDYDGMFVPSLTGLRSNEKGLIAYQHPKRSEADFDASLDNFSFWVIYLSLRLLAIDPRLWYSQQIDINESLAFCSEDFRNPNASPVFHALERCRVPDLQAAAVKMRRFLVSAPRDVENLENYFGLIDPNSFSRSKSRQPSTKTNSSLSKPDWFDSYVENEPVDLNYQAQVRESDRPARKVPIHYLLMGAFSWILVCLGALWAGIMLLMTFELYSGGYHVQPKSSSSDFQQMVFCGVLGTLSLTSLILNAVSGWKCLQQRGGKSLLVASVFNLIPLVSTCFVAGVPFGLYGIFVYEWERASKSTSGLVLTGRTVLTLCKIAGITLLVGLGLGVLAGVAYVLYLAWLWVLAYWIYLVGGLVLLIVIKLVKG